MFWQRLLVLSFLSLSTLSYPKILDQKVCIKESDHGDCLQYKLPFYDYNKIDDYIEPLKIGLSKKAIKNAIELGNKSAEIKQIKSMEDLADIYTSGKDNIKTTKFLKKRLLIALIKIKNFHRKIYPRVSQKHLLKFVHAMFAIVHGFHLDNAPDFTPFNKGQGFTMEKKNTGYRYHSRISLSISDGYEENLDALFITTVLFFIRANSFTFINYTDENVDWLVQNHPELLYKKVVEIGAGNGRLASLLAQRGVDIEVTDIEKAPTDHLFYDVKLESADDVFQRYSTPETDIIFLLGSPTGVGSLLIDNLIRRAGMSEKYAFIILNEMPLVENADRIIKKKFPLVDFHSEKLPRSFNTMYHLSDSNLFLYKLTRKKPTFGPRRRHEL